MKSFFKSFFASLLALVVFSFLGFFIIVGIAAAFSSDEKTTIKENSVLVIDASETFPEKSKNDPFSELLSKKNGKIPSLSELIGLIHNAKKDSTIKGIYIKCAQNPNGYAATEEIRKAIIDFKKSKKFVIAYGETITQKGYMMGNVADQIFTHPQGGLEWNGFSYETLFLKGLLDKLEIQPQVFYAGKFKSATEPFRYTQMSEANKLQTSVWLNSIYNSFLQGTADQRGLQVETLKAIANEGKVQRANDAVQFKLVDGLLYDDQLKKIISKKVNHSEKEDISFVSINEYASAVALRGSGSGKIAVVYADGDVVMGKNEKESIASDDYRILLQKIRNDKSIDAVVIRVNSPGGSSLASDIIWREIWVTLQPQVVIILHAAQILFLQMPILLRDPLGYFPSYPMSPIL
jgi:protease-4